MHALTLTVHLCAKTAKLLPQSSLSQRAKAGRRYRCEHIFIKVASASDLAVLRFRAAHSISSAWEVVAITQAFSVSAELIPSVMVETAAYPS